MAKITSKAQLNVGTELTINTTSREITLNVAGNLVAKDGCSWQALYSKLIDLWTTDSYNDFPFPFYVIDVLSGQFAIGTDGSRYNTWTFAGSTRLYLRDGGWNEYTPTTPGADGTSAVGTLAAQYAGIVSLGSVSTGAQLYYQLTSGGAAANFTYTDAANIGVQVYGDATHGNFDTRTFLKGYCREYAKKYTESVLADTGKTGTGAYIVNLLLSNSDDLDVVNNDTDVIASPIAPYDKMRLNYFSGAFSKDIDTVGSPRNFGIVVDCGTHSGIDGSMSAGGSTLTSATGGITGSNFVGGTLVIHEGTNKGTYNISGTPTGTVVTISGTFVNAQSSISFTLYPAVALNPTLKQIYTFVQAKLRQATNINNVAGGTSVTGKTASLLLNWTAKLVAGFYAPTNPAGGGSGVIIEGVANADSNSVEFYDNSAVKREYPYSAAGIWSFSSNLVGAGSYYRMYFTTLPGAGNDYGEAGAITVNDASGSPIAGTISGNVNFTFDYTNNVQGGRTPNQDAAVTLVAGRPGFAKPVVATGLLTASKGIVLSSVAETDRGYA